MTNPKNFNEAKKEFLATFSNNKKNAKSLSFIVDINGDAAGEIDLLLEDKHKAKISYWLGKKYRGQGIMTKAVKLFTNYAFNKYKIKRIYGYVRTFNKPSLKVLKNAGYKLEGILRKNKFKEGKYLDDMVWAKVK